MNLNLSKLKTLNKAVPSIGLLLALALVAVLLYEAYLAYQYVYKNLIFDPADITPSNIVRVNLDSYQDTIRFLDEQKNFETGPLNLQRGNPFRP
jgi:hypothetical protein